MFLKISLRNEKTTSHKLAIIFYKRFAHRIQREPLQCNCTKRNTILKKVAKGLNRYFNKEDIQMAN